MENEFTSGSTPDFLERNAEVHDWVFGAMAELIDNALDAGAAHLKISSGKKGKTQLLIIHDDGHGMNEDNLKACLSFGKTTKQGKNKIGQYGVGFKSGSMRIAKDVIVFTKDAKTMSIGLLSQTYLKATNKDQIKFHVVTWPKAEAIPQELSDSAERVLGVIHRYSPYANTKGLSKALGRIVDKGTQVVLYNLKGPESGKTELDFSKPGDILIREECRSELRNEIARDIAIDYSLRAYLEYLYCDPKLIMELRMIKVRTSRVEKSFVRKTQTKYTYTIPGKEIKVDIVWGFSPEARKKDLYGVMMYHRNRLVKSYHKVGMMKEANRRQFPGIIGVVQVDFLTVKHNKQDFRREGLYDVVENIMGHSLKRYWLKYFEEDETKTFKRMKEYENLAAEFTWVQCNQCLKWRKLLPNQAQDLKPEWYCRENPNSEYDSCLAPQEPYGDVDEVILNYNDTQDEVVEQHLNTNSKTSKVVSKKINKQTLDEAKTKGKKRPKKNIEKLSDKMDSINITSSEDEKEKPPEKKIIIKKEPKEEEESDSKKTKIKRKIQVDSDEEQQPKKSKFAEDMIKKKTQEAQPVKESKSERKATISRPLLDPWEGDILIKDSKTSRWKHITHLLTVDRPVQFPPELRIRRLIPFAQYPKFDRVDFHLELHETAPHDSHEFKTFFQHIGKNKYSVEVTLGNTDALILPPPLETMATFSELSKLDGVVLTQKERTLLYEMKTKQTYKKPPPKEPVFKPSSPVTPPPISPTDISQIPSTVIGDLVKDMLSVGRVPEKPKDPRLSITKSSSRGLDLNADVD